MQQPPHVEHWVRDHLKSIFAAIYNFDQPTINIPWRLAMNVLNSLTNSLNNEESNENESNNQNSI